MASSSLQLDVENALKSFIASQSILGLTSANIYPAHAKQKIDPDTKGTYLGIIADTPAWEPLIVNAEIKVTFEIATAGMQDHDKAPQASVDHSTRVGQVLDLFSWQNLQQTRDTLNVSSFSLGVGFTGYEPLKPEPDGMSQDGTQIITKLSYTFEVYLS